MPHWFRYSIFLISYCIYSNSIVAQNAYLQVLDAKTKHALPFATIKYGDGRQGTVTDIDGLVALNNLSGYDSIEVCYIGYISNKVELSTIRNRQGVQVLLKENNNRLAEVVVAPPYEKIRHIINQAITNRDINNPDKNDWYRCHVYYKMIASDVLPDSLFNKKPETKKDSLKRSHKKKVNPEKSKKDSLETIAVKQFLDSTNLIESETYSIRTWQQPQRLQEDVIGTRFSGLHKNIFTSLITDVLPFHAYNNYITLNGKDYHNPISPGFFSYYDFNLNDEFLQDKDTVWVLSFRPKGNKSNQIKGTVYINSNGYAIEKLIAANHDTELHRTVRIEQQYEYTKDINSATNHWFPRHLNYIIDWKFTNNDKSTYLYMKGKSDIDSITWQPEKGFKFDKTHTVKVRNGGDELPDSVWLKLRPEALDRKEAYSYNTIDSIGNKYHFDKYAEAAGKAGIGKLPVKIFDLDYSKFLSANPYENIRLGMGLQTNEHISKLASVGAWAGYGFHDAHWKYEIFGELYGDKSHETVLRLGYTDDITAPGRVVIDRDLDKNYLAMYLLNRVDEVKSSYLSLTKRWGYWHMKATFQQQDITPMYFIENGPYRTKLPEFSATEASINFRYAFAERTSPIMGYYYSLGSKYPIWYGKITLGQTNYYGTFVPYTQALTAIFWHKHINRIGFEHILLEGGKIWNNGELPVSKLFAGNGYSYGNWSLYSFGGFMTMSPFQYYSDQFVSVNYRHDFDWKFYNIGIPEAGISSAPFLSLSYDMLYGTLSYYPWRSFSVPDQRYNEFGLVVNSLLRVRYYNSFYLTFNTGYFYHPSFHYGNDKSFIVFGVGVEL